MPVLPLKPFLAYKQSEFRIGGNPAKEEQIKERLRWIFMFDYDFPQELEDAIDAATAKFGPIECD